MCSPATHYRVFHVAVTSKPQEPDNHYIYVDCQTEESGLAYLVVGDLENGHRFVHLPKTKHPRFYFQRTQLMRHIGWVAHEHLELLEDRLEHIQPPGRQVEWGNLVVPLERVRSSRTWTAEAIEILLGEGYFVERGWKDKIGGVLRRLKSVK